MGGVQAIVNHTYRGPELDLGGGTMQRHDGDETEVVVEDSRLMVERLRLRRC